MKKYWVYFLQNIHELLTYRARLILVVVSQFIAPLTMIWVFTGLAGNKFAGMSKEQLISYYIYTSILFIFLSTSVDTFIGESIQNGNIANYLLKPVKFWLVALERDLSARLFKLALGIPIFIAITLIYPILVIGDIKIQLVILSLLISFCLTFTLATCIGYLAFWFEEFWGFQNLKDVSILLLSGVVLPYSFFPKALQTILVYTPFPYLINWPLRLGFSGNVGYEFISALLWLLFLSASSWLMWKKGLRKYSAMGVY